MSSSGSTDRNGHGPIRSRVPSSRVSWGCEIRTHPLSLAPLSARLKHGPDCRCGSREKAAIERYILDWMSYRMTCLGEHPIRTSTRARVTCEFLGVDGLNPVLDRIDALYPIQL